MILAVVTIAAIFFYLAYEFVALITERKLITTHVREMYRAYPPMVMLVGLIVGLLLGHFFWCP